jgi:hypothetical protein
MAAAQKEANPARSEVIYDLDAAAFCSDDFRMFQFKVGGPAWRRTALSPAAPARRPLPPRRGGTLHRLRA